MIYNIYLVILLSNNNLDTVIIMEKFKRLQLKMLNEHMINIKICDRPSDGWIRSVRKAIGMSIRQLAERIGVTQQAISKLEEHELDDSVTLKTLRRAAEAMDCKLVYAIIPNQGNLEDIVRKQAYNKAKSIVEPVNHTMLLEAQEVGDLHTKITEITDELVNKLNSKLWNK